MSEPALDELRLRRLIDAGRNLTAKLDVDAVLRQRLDVARDVTGARYAAVGVLDVRQQELERFVTAGIDADTRRAIGDLPRGRGILGLLIEEPRPLRLEHIGDHPQSYGFPAVTRRAQLSLTTAYWMRSATSTTVSPMREPRR